MRALVNQRFSLPVAVEIVVVVRVTLHQRQKGGGIVVIGQPAVARDLKIAIVALLEQHLEFHALSFDIQAELGLPLRRGKHGHFLVVLAGVVGEGVLGARLDASLFQQLLGLSHAFVHRPGCPVIGLRAGTLHPGHDEAVGRGLAIGRDALRQDVTVNHHRQRLAHAHVGKSRILVLQGVVAQADHGRVANFFGELRLGLLIRTWRQLVNPLILARLKQLDVGRAVFNRQVGHFGQLHIGSVPILRIFLDHNAVVDLPLLQDVSPVAHEIARLGPVFAVFLERRLVDRTQIVVAHQRRQKTHRVRRFDLQRELVQRLDTQLGGRLGAFDHIRAIEQKDAKGVGIHRCGFWV